LISVSKPVNNDHLAYFSKPVLCTIIWSEMLTKSIDSLWALLIASSRLSSRQDFGNIQGFQPINFWFSQWYSEQYRCDSINFTVTTELGIAVMSCVFRYILLVVILIWQ